MALMGEMKEKYKNLYRILNIDHHISKGSRTTVAPLKDIWLDFMDL